MTQTAVDRRTAQLVAQRQGVATMADADDLLAEVEAHREADR